MTLDHSHHIPNISCKGHSSNICGNKDMEVHLQLEFNEHTSVYLGVGQRRAKKY